MTDVTDDRYPCALGVYCDRCGVDVLADFLVRDSDDSPTRLGYIRAHVRKQGWRCDAEGDFCPEHAEATR